MHTVGGIHQLIMEITLITDQFPAQGSGVPRSPGLHLTDIIEDMYCTLHPRAYEGAKGWDLTLAGEMGFTWERVLEMALGSRLGVRPGELECDGVVGSPDGVDPDDWMIEEIKLTWRSCNEDPLGPRWWKWRTQAMAYSWMLGPLNESEGDYAQIRWRVVYIVGDWKGSGPQYREYRGRVAVEELSRNWRMLIHHAKERGMLR